MARQKYGLNLLASAALLLLAAAITITLVLRLYRSSDPVQVAAGLQETEANLALAIEQERQQLALVEIKRLKSNLDSTLVMLDELEDEVELWHGTFDPMLKGEEGHKLASSEDNVRIIASLMNDLQQHGQVDIDGARDRLNTIDELLEARIADPKLRNTPSNTYETQLSLERERIASSLESHRNARRTIEGLQARAAETPPAEAADPAPVDLATAVEQSDTEKELREQLAMAEAKAKAMEEGAARRAKEAYEQQKAIEDAKADKAAAEAEAERAKLAREAEAQRAQVARQAREARERQTTLAELERLRVIAHDPEAEDLMTLFISNISHPKFGRLYQDEPLFHKECDQVLARNINGCYNPSPYYCYCNLNRNALVEEYDRRNSIAYAKYKLTLHQLFRTWLDSAYNQRRLGGGKGVKLDLTEVIVQSQPPWTAHWTWWNQNLVPLPLPKYDNTRVFLAAPLTPVSPDNADQDLTRLEAIAHDPASYELVPVFKTWSLYGAGTEYASEQAFQRSLRFGIALRFYGNDPRGPGPEALMYSPYVNYTYNQFENDIRTRHNMTLHQFFRVMLDSSANQERLAPKQPVIDFLTSMTQDPNISAGWRELATNMLATGDATPLPPPKY